MGIPDDYEERVYAGVLGKIIGVYLGRPFEGWSYERISKELGEITYYVNDRLNLPLIVTDDDISGTFTFIRALPDHGNDPAISSEEIGLTWLNYIIEGRTTLWWGGMANSTEHTAFLRLKGGIPAPRSGSIVTNGATVAEQIGAEIFIDGWAMVCPGDPERAAGLAGRAASVSHDGEAVHGAQVVAAMEAAAFVEDDIDRLLDTGLRVIPADCRISRLIQDIRGWHAADGDWKKTRARIEQSYGYAKFPGHVHVVPNHALIILALLYGEGSFRRSLMIANTSGWDTDCNSGNVGCLLGIKDGLAGIEREADWRGPIADRMFLSTAEGSRGITDAASEALEIASIGRALAVQPAMPPPKRGARYHFTFPGSLQGFALLEPPGESAGGTLENVVGHSELGSRSLAIRYLEPTDGESLCATAPTFIPPEAIHISNYPLYAWPKLYPGQSVHARVEADSANRGVTEVCLVIRIYGADDELETRRGAKVRLRPGEAAVMDWEIDDTGDRPIASVGVEIAGERRASTTVYLDYLSWDGSPRVRFMRPRSGGTMWRRAWIDATDHFEPRWTESFSVSQDRGTGLLSTGASEWRDYELRATVSTDLAKEFGIAARVGGLLRYYALVLTDHASVELVKQRERRTVLARTDLPWKLGVGYELCLKVAGNRLVGSVAGRTVFDVRDPTDPLSTGGIGLVCSEGKLVTDEVLVLPAT